MDLRNEQLKDTYGNLVTTGTTAGSPTSGGLQNGQGTLLTSVGIGTDSPNALFDVTSGIGSTKLTGHQIFLTRNGNNEIYAQGASSVLALGANSLEKMRIDSSGDISFRDGSGSEAFYWDASAGSLGIGTTSPNSPLTATKLLSGNSYLSPQSIRSSIENASVYGYFSSDSDDLTANKEQAGVLGIARVDSGTAPGSGNAVYGVLGVSSNAYGGGVNDFALGAIGDAYISGNVGIGTTSPSEKLQINSGYIKVVDNAYDEYFFSKERTDGSQLVGFQSHSAGALSIHSAGTERMRINSSGNVGIGTDAPGARLNVAGALGAVIGGGASAIRMTNTDTSNYASISAGIVGTSNGGMDFSVDGTRRMVISGSGNVGIGTDAPSAPLSIDTGTTGTIAQFRGADTDILNIDGDSDAIVLDARNVAYLGFEMQGSERMRIDSSGNVGIGCSPSAKLDVDSGSTQTVSVFKASSTSTATNNGGALIGIRNTNDTDGNMEGLFFQNSNGNSTSGIIGYNVNHSTNEGLMTFGVRNSSGTFGEKMRINSSGNVLVGKTTSSIASEGVELFPNDRSAFTRDSGYSILVNRLTSDGDLINFRKDGTTVGSIGTEGGDMAIGNGDAGLQFIDGTQSIRPFNLTTNARIDAQVDLGMSTTRFKDLYLSGSVYLGGTTSSNALDDYEEGTWTPAYTPTTGTFTTITTVATGRYTKIGRLVTVFGNVRTSGTLDVTGASGNLAITGLPFACNATLAGGGVDISHQLWNLGTDILNTGLSVDAGASQILMFKNTMNTSSFPSGNITVADMSTSGGSFNNLITFTVSYEV
jgi:hypothetical protein